MRYRYLLGASFLLLLAVGIAVGWVLATEPGLRLAFTVAQQLLPGQLSYGRIAGRLIGPLEAEDLQYRAGELEVGLGRAALDWSPSALLAGRLHLTSLRTEELELHLPPGTPDAEKPQGQPLRLDDIVLPLQVEIADLALRNTRIWLPETAEPVLIHALTLQAQTHGRIVVLETLEARAPLGVLALAGRLALSGANALELRLTATLQHAAYGPLNVQGNVTGALGETLSVNLDTAGVVRAQLAGQAFQVMRDPGWSVDLDVRVPDLGQLSPDLLANELSLQLQTKGRLDHFDMAGALMTELPEIGQVNLDFEGVGSSQAIQIKHLAVRSAHRPLTLDMGAQISLADLAFQVDGHWHFLGWPLTSAPTVTSPAGQFSARGVPTAYELQLYADLATSQTGEAKVKLKVLGTDQDIRVSELSLRAAESELSLAAQGELRFAELAFQTNGTWRSVAWPLIGTPQVESSAGSFEASGSIKDYRFELDAEIDGIDIPRGHWSLAGTGSDQALHSLSLNGRLLDGEVSGKASATWHPSVSWQAQLMGQGLNPGIKWPALPGKLAAQLHSHGSLVDGALRTTLRLEGLSGSFRTQDIQGKGQLAIQDQDVVIQGLELSLGRAQLETSGTLAQSWDLRWQLQAPDLSRLLPGAGGRVSSSGSLKGSPAALQADLELALEQVVYENIAIERLQGEANVDVSGKRLSRISFTGEALRLAEQRWEKIVLDGSGTPARHALQGTFAGDLGRFALAAEGGLGEAKQAWQGKITRLDAKNTKFGDWNLKQATPLQISTQQAVVERSCLVSTPTQLCLEGRWNAATGAEGRLNLAQLDLERFAVFLPDELELDAELSGQVVGVRRPDGRVRGEAALRLSPGSLVFHADGSTLEIPLGGGELLRVQSDGENASAKIDLEIGPMGRLEAAAQVSELLGQARINGTLDAQLTDLKAVTAFLPQASSVAGQALADVRVSGALKAPTITGGVRIENAAMEIPEFAVRIEDIQVAARGDAQSAVQLSGSARSGEGLVELTGQLEPTTGRLELNLKGKNFQVANSSEIQALISPDLNLSMERDQLRVEGKITIPKARVRSRAGGGSSSPGQVSSSADVVIIRQADGTEPPTEEKEGLPLFADIQVILGDVQVSAFDFNGKLKGDLRVKQAPRLLPRGTGEVEVEAGEYTISGQRLKMERGRVLFSNSLLDDPGLDLRVTRQIDNAVHGGGDERRVIAGAQVAGTLQNPKLTFFSTPAMPDNLIVSYLVFGRALRSDEGTSIGLGRHLSPNIYVGYNVGIFDALNTYIARYRLSKQIELEASSNSESSGGDVIYTIELP